MKLQGRAGGQLMQCINTAEVLYLGGKLLPGEHGMNQSWEG